MSNPELSAKILKSVLAERDRAERLHGNLPRNLTPSAWAIVLSEEMGEVARALLEADSQQYEAELIQVAATAIAALEDFYSGASNLTLEDVCGRFLD